MADIATLVGLSHRGFIEIFKREVGLTPKLYARIQRFHGAKERIAALGCPPSWAAFAIECGYFDQSHLIRDFTAFSGLSPTSYLRSQAGETGFDHFVHSFGRVRNEAHALSDSRAHGEPPRRATAPQRSV